MKKQELATERLELDIERAIYEAAARAAVGRADGQARLNAVVDSRWFIRNCVTAALRRNWTVVERARGERSIG